MGLFSFFRSGNYFDKNIAPKCDYCRYGKRAKDGNKVLCEQRGLVDAAYSCSKFIYSPLKRIPVKQLNFVGSLADEDLYIESAGDRAEKEEENNKDKAPAKKTDTKKESTAKKSEAPAEEKKAETKAEEKKPEAPVEEKKNAETEKPEEKPVGDNNATAAQNAEVAPANETPAGNNAPAE